MGIISKYNKNQMKKHDSIKKFLIEIGKHPLLTVQQEVEATCRYQKYHTLELIKESNSNNTNLKLVDYNNVIAVKKLEIIKRGSNHISLNNWAKLLNIVVSELDEILLDGKTQWAALSNVTLEELIQIETEGLKARDLLLKSNIRLVVSIAKKHMNRGLELLDLIQEGMIGLNTAVNKFDPGRGYRLTTYAYPWIKQSIGRAIAKFGREIRIPVHIIELISKISKTYQKLIITEESITIDVLSEKMKKPIEQIKFALENIPRALSTDVRLGEHQETALIDMLPCYCPTPSQLLEINMIEDAVPSLMSTLNQREQQVINLRYGITGEAETLGSIGEIVGLSRERIRQIERNAMQKLRASASDYQEIKELLSAM